MWMARAGVRNIRCRSTREVPTMNELALLFTWFRVEHLIILDEAKRGTEQIVDIPINHSYVTQRKTLARFLEPLVLEIAKNLPATRVNAVKKTY